MTTAPPILDSDDVEFTFEWYDRLLAWLDDAGYTASSFDTEPADGTVLLRHDVDLSPRKALVMGRLEAERGMSATYFFLATSPLYNVLDAPNRRILAELDALGHRVGLHFNTHQYWDAEPELTELRGRIDDIRQILSTAAPSADTTVSFHCPPDWALDRTFEGIRHTYEPRFFSEIGYTADSGQRWRDEPVLGEPLPDRFQLLTHPGLWGPTDESYINRVTVETKTNLDRAERYVTRELIEDRFEAIDYPYGDILDESSPPG